jgi:hypothetical protein
MLQVLKSFEGKSVHATDGPVGKIYDFYFDSHDWVVRWAVVEMDGRKVLLPPTTFGKPDANGEAFNVNLTSDRIRQSPDWNADRPVSRQYEINLHDYYQWPYYWNSSCIPGMIPNTGLAAAPLVDMAADVEGLRSEQAGPSGDPDLHSSRVVRGYRLGARDGEIGKISDFVIDDESWRIMYLIADTGSWLTDRKVIVSPSWITKIEWPDGLADINLDRETIKNSPRYDPNAPIDRKYEEDLYQHYSRPKYWN